MRQLLLFAIFIFAISPIKGQILDDSTKQIYSIKTVNYILEKDVLNNSATLYNPDTSLKDFHKTNKITQNDWLFQDLGNAGTASKSIFYIPFLDISTQFGMNAFSLYAPNLNEIKYYNTKSPYSSLGYIQGFKGNSNLKFTHSQNITKKLNITLDLHKFNSSKQIGATTAEDRLIDSWTYNFSSNYEYKKYQFLVAFYHFNHLQNEQGGIQKENLLSIEPSDLLGSYRTNYQAQLQNGVFNRERWNNFHLYQQYKLKNGFQAFHVLDYTHQKYIFQDNKFQTNLLTNSYSFNRVIYPVDTVASKIIDTLVQNRVFSSFSNKFGLKGRYKGFDYRVYIRQRTFSLNSNYGDKYKLPTKNEVFLGGQLAYYLKDSTNNINVSTEIGSNLNFFVLGEINFKNFKGSFLNSLNPVPIFYQYYYNPQINWGDNTLKANSFSDIYNLQIKGTFDFKVNNWKLKPGATYQVFRNYTYLDQNLVPKQFESSTGLKTFNLITFNLFLAYNRDRFSFSNTSILTLNPQSTIVRIPTFINNSNIEFQIKYARVLKIYTGLDIYFKTKYKAEAYAPIINQFYLQDDFYVWGFPSIEPYLAFNINKVRLAFKFGHGNQGILSPNGFYTTPYYLAMPRNFLIKVDWPLFD